jgi:hypothetical protein
LARLSLSSWQPSSPLPLARSGPTHLTLHQAHTSSSGEALHFCPVVVFLISREGRERAAHPVLTCSPGPPPHVSLFYPQRCTLLETLALSSSLAPPPHPRSPWFPLYLLTESDPNSHREHHLAMASPLQGSPHHSEGTIRCGSSSSSSPCKESSQYPVNRAQGRRFFAPDFMLLLRFRPPSSSSGQTEPAFIFLVTSRVPGTPSAPSSPLVCFLP